MVGMALMVVILSRHLNELTDPAASIGTLVAFLLPGKRTTDAR